MEPLGEIEQPEMIEVDVLQIVVVVVNVPEITGDGEQVA